MSSNQVSEVKSVEMTQIHHFGPFWVCVCVCVCVCVRVCACVRVYRIFDVLFGHQDKVSIGDSPDEITSPKRKNIDCGHGCQILLEILVLNACQLTEMFFSWVGCQQNH